MPLASDAEFTRLSAALGEVVADPRGWHVALERVAAFAGAAGAVLLQSDVRTGDVPRTESIEALFRRYFEEGWHRRDIRTRAIPAIMTGRVVSDDDILTRDEMRSQPYYTDLLRSYGFQWFAGLGFHAGPSHWAVSIQRTEREGAFEADLKAQLARLSPRLTEVATLSHAVGRSVLDGMKSAFDAVGQPAILLNKAGRVLDWNRAADRLLGDDLKIVNGQLRLRDPSAAEKLDALLRIIRLTRDGAALAAPAFAIARRDARPVLVRAVAIDGPAQTFLIGASAMLLLHDLTPDTQPRSADQIRAAFQISPAEARLVARLAAGDSVAIAAEYLGIARETARNQLKSALSKTGTHRQAELIGLVSRIPDPRARP